MIYQFLEYVASWFWSPEPAVWLIRNGWNRVNDHFRQFMNTSGSAQPTVRDLEQLRDLLEDKELWVIDLRQESHGFVNNLPISWYQKENSINWDKNLEQIDHSEEKLLNTLTGSFTSYKSKKENGVRVATDPKIEIIVQPPKTEWQICFDLSINYLRVPVPDFHPPSNDIVDQFLRFLNKVSIKREVLYDSQIDTLKFPHVHFHCEGGKGRTTTFMTMCDIYANCHECSLEEIVLRQKHIGGINLFDYNDSPEWKEEDHLKRVEFIKNFYQYCLQKDQSNLDWSSWINI